MQLHIENLEIPGSLVHLRPGMTIQTSPKRWIFRPLAYI